MRGNIYTLPYDKFTFTGGLHGNELLPVIRTNKEFSRIMSRHSSLYRLSCHRASNGTASRRQQTAASATNSITGSTANQRAPTVPAALLPVSFWIVMYLTPVIVPCDSAIT